jgi:hypothetical protein
MRLFRDLLPRPLNGSARSRSGLDGDRIRNIGTEGSQAPDRLLLDGAVPRSLTVDHGTEFTALEEWGWRRGAKLDYRIVERPTAGRMSERQSALSIEDAKEKSKPGDRESACRVTDSDAVTCTRRQNTKLSSTA